MVAEVHILNILPLFNVSALFGFIASISTTSATLGTLAVISMRYVYIFLISLIIISCSYEDNQKVIIGNFLKKDNSYINGCFIENIDTYNLNNKESFINYTDIQETARGYPTTELKLKNAVKNYLKNNSYLKTSDFINDSSIIFERINSNYGNFYKIYKPIIIDKNFYIIPFIEYSNNGEIKGYYVKKADEEYIAYKNILSGCL